MRSSQALLLVVALLIAATTEGYKAHDFRLCRDTSFCRRHRSVSGGGGGGNREDTYALADAPTLSADSLVATATLVHPKAAESPAGHLTLSVSAYGDCVFRMQVVNEHEKSKHQRYVPSVALSDAATPVPITVTQQRGDNDGKPVLVSISTTHSAVSGGNSGGEKCSLRVHMSPFSAEMLINTDGGGGDKAVLGLNTHGWMRYERYINQGEEHNADTLFENVDKDGLWEENFGSHRDSKPFGPSSVGVDITHLGAAHVYGLPQRAASMSLADTVGTNSDPYRLYNLDVFEFDTRHPHQPLYGAVPLLLGHSSSVHTGVLWLNPSETFIDISTQQAGKRAHWFSESGAIDVFLMASRAAVTVQKQYASITGTLFMPPLFSVAYHQCRWNYNDEGDVRSVDASFDEHDIPYDVLWLDIEHTDGKKYFTWDSRKFPNPAQLQTDLASRGRRMVTIVDPHLKIDNGYSVYQEGKSQGMYVKNRDGNDFEGHCWPGGSMWLDYLDTKVQQYWASRFALERYPGSSKHLYTWNDMNEPSVFNGPEITMPKDNKHHGGVEHREIHNMYGFLMTSATVMGHELMRPGERPFVLSRSFFAGSQRHVAVWTGDNEASWDSLRITTPMLLTLSASGIHFCGADIGGFFKNPDPELLVRWYQMAAFQPFMRAHAHIETNRREPWLFGTEVMHKIRAAIRSRYVLLPYIYTLFHISHTTGVPVMRPMFMEFGKDEHLFAVDDQFLLGPSLLIKPSASPNQHTTSILLPQHDPQRWFDYFSGVEVHGHQPTLQTPGDKIAVLQRGGSIIPQRRRARRSSTAMTQDPYTLQIALSTSGQATGVLHVDDGVSKHSLSSGMCSTREFVVKDGRLSSREQAGSHRKQYDSSLTIERIVIYGVTSAPSKVSIGDDSLQFVYDSAAGVLTIKKPDVRVSDDFDLVIA